MKSMTEDRRTEIVSEYEKDLLEGKVFFRHSASAASVIGYVPPVSWRDFARVTKYLGDLATRSEELAYLVEATVRNMGGLGLDRYQFEASVWRAAESAVRKGWTDISLKASPEPGRPSSWEKRYSLQTLLEFLVVVNEAFEGRRSIGWVAAILIEENRVYIREVR